MSAGGAFGGARGYQPKAPDKGVFPLDHFGECKQVKDAYMDCLKLHSQKADRCVELAKQYLQCRMDRNLMARQDLKELGFKEQAGSAAAGKEEDLGETRSSGSTARRKQGFIAGMQR